PYAAHHESIKLSSVEVRYYQGWCESDEAIKKQIDLFLSKKAEIMAMPALITGLNEKSIAHVTNYLNDFFTIIENPRKLENMVIRHCDMWPVKE
ncbi:MAG: hypothetical protein M3R25_15760, partial [Bacteroidota bacterium]|nr:hypothetical protein [Bacteroidota bacterium]